MFLSVIFVFVIIGIYMKTEHSIASASLWAIFIAIFAFSYHGIGYQLIVVPISFFLGWGLFSLASYWEDSIFLRLFALVLSMFAMLVTFGSVT